jgi:hypothetical protein
MTVKSMPLTYDDYVSGIQTLTPEEQLDLIEIISANLKTTIKKKQEKPISKLANLKRRKLINGDPDDLVDIKVWEWNEQQNL